MINILSLELLQLGLVGPGCSLIQVDGTIDGARHCDHSPAHSLEQQSSDQETYHGALTGERGQSYLGHQTPLIGGNTELI